MEIHMFNPCCISEKRHLIMVESFKYLAENFCIFIHRGTLSYSFLFCCCYCPVPTWFEYQSRVTLESQMSRRAASFHFFVSLFLAGLRSIDYRSSLKVQLNFPMNLSGSRYYQKAFYYCLNPICYESVYVVDLL